MLIRLDSHPRINEFHFWADYAELLCLFNEDGILSKADFEDVIADGSDLGEEEYLESDLDLSVPEYNDVFSQKTDDIFIHLKYRQEAFEDFYPFYLDPRQQIHLKDSLSELARFYIFLLLASNLGKLTKVASRNKIADDFEVICVEALRNMLPTSAEVHIFGPRHGSKYSGNTWRKINSLASDLSETVRVPESDFDKRSTGDEGLDIVAWIPIGDENVGRLLLFAQCACTPEWKTKQHSSSADSWNHIMSFKSPPTNLSFIPFHFRRADGSWCATKDIKAILVDRQRLVHLLGSDTSALSSFPGLDFVDQILKDAEPE